MIGTHAIKVKVPESKRFEFLTPTGGLTHLRIHAATTTKVRCDDIAAKIRLDYPDYDVRVVKL